MGEEQFNQLVQFFKVLGNESRLKILGLLAGREHSVGELAEALELTEPTVSHHLALMRELGIVQVRAEGTTRIYSLDSKELERMNKDVFSQQKLADLVEARVPMSNEQKVLQTFVENGRIKELPSRYQKRLIVLNWLVDHFDWDVRYTEAEISERLKVFHPDYAALRRYLVETGLMQRAKGLYWRVRQD
jgi:DNA-binding transcriptional ArsR family regulator